MFSFFVSQSAVTDLRYNKKIINSHILLLKISNIIFIPEYAQRT